MPLLRRRGLASRFFLGLALCVSARLAGDDRAAPPIQLEDRQPASGIGFVLDNGTTADKPVIDAVLGGLALLDFDNDGLLDVFFSNGARIPGLAKALRPPSRGVVFWSWEALAREPEKRRVVREVLAQR